MVSMQVRGPPTYVHLKSTSVATHQAWSAGHQKLGDPYDQDVVLKLLKAPSTGPTKTLYTRWGSSS
jgi:hypothetical protein